MNVGNYVRTPKGIGKIIDKLDNERFSYPGAWVTDTYLEIYEDTEYIYDEDIIKSSPQIIDLVEKGDVLVDYNDNLYKVEKVYLNYVFTDKKNEHGQTITLVDYQIKYIMTNEQFKSEAYKVEE